MIPSGSAQSLGSDASRHSGGSTTAYQNQPSQPSPLRRLLPAQSASLTISTVPETYETPLAGASPLRSTNHTPDNGTNSPLSQPSRQTYIQIEASRLPMQFSSLREPQSLSSSSSLVLQGYTRPGTSGYASSSSPDVYVTSTGSVFYPLGTSVRSFIDNRFCKAFTNAGSLSALMPDRLAPLSTMASSAMLETSNYLIDEVALMNTVNLVYESFNEHMNVQADLVFEQYFAASIRNDPAQMRTAVMGLLQSDLFIHKTLTLEKWLPSVEEFRRQASEEGLAFGDLPVPNAYQVDVSDNTNVVVHFGNALLHALTCRILRYFRNPVTIEITNATFLIPIELIFRRLVEWVSGVHRPFPGRVDAGDHLERLVLLKRQHVHNIMDCVNNTEEHYSLRKIKAMIRAQVLPPERDIPETPIQSLYYRTHHKVLVPRQTQV